MRSLGVGFGLVLLCCAQAGGAVDPGLGWAYPASADKADSAPLPEGSYAVEGSALSPLSKAQIRALDFMPDWLPQGHPPAPFIIMHPRKDGASACAECHLTNGQGFLGATNLAGLPAAYIVEQVREFRSGRRTSSEPGRLATQLMIEEAKAVTDRDLAEAAAYFAAVKPSRNVTVVETATVPKTKSEYFNWLYLDPQGGTEPIGGRIIEVADDLARFMINDPQARLKDYVPVGSVAQGTALARRPNSLGQTCMTCHGETLQGSPLAPPLAGRYASYLARMLWDIKTGSRQGPTVALMQPTVSGLSAADIVALCAYLASLPPAQDPPVPFVATAPAPGP